MRISLLLGVVLAGAVCGSAACGDAVREGLGEGLGKPIDLAGFTEMMSQDEALPIEDVSVRTDATARRFYVSGIIGNSFESFAYPATGFVESNSVFTAGGAAGVWFARPTGAVRLEIEGRGRSDLTSVDQLDTDVFITERYTDNWSTLVNAWRDIEITERLGMYAGGGLGAGGFRRSSQSSGFEPPQIDEAQAVTTFAWQGGGGVIYDVSERITLDFGYRFYGLQPSKSIETDRFLWFPTTLSASEFLLSVRVYEPFRRWR